MVERVDRRVERPRRLVGVPNQIRRAIQLPREPLVRRRVDARVLVRLSAKRERLPTDLSGGAAKGTEEVYAEIRQLRDGGANGSIIGRNSFQRSREDALELLRNIIKIYQGKF